jgi:hypothetical protein
MQFLVLLNPATAVCHIRIIQDDLEAEAQAEALAMKTGATLSNCEWMAATDIDIQSFA